VPNRLAQSRQTYFPESVGNWDTIQALGWWLAPQSLSPKLLTGIRLAAQLLRVLPI